MKMANQKSQSMEKIIMDKEKEKLSKEIVSSYGVKLVTMERQIV